MTANGPTDIPVSGWFTDPSVAGQERWWDGEAWGEQIRPKTSASAVAPGDFRGWIARHRVPVLVIGAIVVLAVIVGAVVAGRSSTNYNKAAFEQGLMASMNDQIDFTRIQKVDCPSSPPTSQGTTFECLAKGINGSNFVVTVTFQDDEGGYLWRLE